MSGVDPRFRDFLAQRAPQHSPDGLLPGIMAATAGTPQARTWAARWPVLRAALPVVAGVVLVAAIAIAFILVGRQPPPVGPNESGDGTPSSVASSSAAASASPTATAAPVNATPAPSLAPVDGLVAGPGTCVNDDLRFSVTIPGGWYTNDPLGGIPPCMMFSRESFDRSIAGIWDEVPAKLEVVQGKYVPSIGDVVEEMDLTLDGMPAFRQVVQFFADRTVRYIVSLDGSPPSLNGDEFVVYATIRRKSPSFDADVAGLDEILAGFHRVGAQPIEPREIARIALPHTVGDRELLVNMATTSDSIWTSGGLTLVRTDLATNRVAITTPTVQSLLATDSSGGLWALGPLSFGLDPLDVSRVNPSSGSFVPLATLDGGTDLAVGLSRIWVAHGDVLGLDPVTGNVVQTLPGDARIVRTGCGDVWTWTYEDSSSSWSLSAFDPASGRLLATHRLPYGSREMTELDGLCWTQDVLAMIAFRPDGSGPVISTPIPIDESVYFVGESVWTLDRYGVVQRIDPATGEALGAAWRLPAGDVEREPAVGPLRLLAAGGNLWVLNGPTLIRYDIPAS